MALSRAVRQSITEEMARQGVSQRELARRLGLGQRYVWRRTSSNTKAALDFTPDEIERVANALGVPVSRLIPAEVTA